MEEDKRNFFDEILSSGIVGFRSFFFGSAAKKEVRNFER
jgi:hypothetical protein